MSEPNFYRLVYHAPMGAERGFEKNTKTIPVDDLDKELYCINDIEYVISITPLYVTEVEYPQLTGRDVVELFNDMEEHIEIARLNKQLSDGNKMIREAAKMLDKLT